MKKKNTNVELMRIIACLIVIGVHTCLSATSEGEVDMGRLFLACLFADGVAIFWLISGFFMFDRGSYKSLVKKTVRNIVIPMALFSVLVFYLGDWLFQGTPLLESVHHSKEDYINVIISLIKWTNPVNYLGHLWYLYAYLMIVAIFPLLRAFVMYLDEKRERTLWFLAGSLAFLVMNDISSNQLAAFSHHSINAVVPACIEIIWGHIIYRNREKLCKRHYAFLSVFAFVLINVIRTLIQRNRYYAETPNNYILYWYSSLGLMCAICVVIFGLSALKSDRETPLNKAIRVLGGYTFSIYLLHPMVTNTFNRFGVQSRLQEFVLGGRTAFVYELSYSVCIVLIVFSLALAVSVLLRQMSKGLKKLAN